MTGPANLSHQVLDDLINSIRDIAANESRNNLDFMALQKAFLKLISLNKIAVSLNDTDMIKRIDLAFQELNKIKCTNPPEKITSLKDQINALVNDAEKHKTNKREELIEKFHQLQDQFNGTSYSDEMLIADMRKKLNLICDELNIPQHDRKIHDKSTLLQVSQRDFDATFSIDKRLGAGYFGCVDKYKYTGQNELLKSMASDDFVVAKQLISSATANDEVERQKKKCSIETHLNEASLAGQSYSGIALNVDGKVFIVAPLITYDLEFKLGKIEDIIEEFDIFSGEPENLHQDLVSSAKSHTGESYLKGFAASLPTDDNVDIKDFDLSKHEAAKQLVDVLMLFANGIHQSQHEKHMKGFLHCDTALRNTMVVKNVDGDLKIVSIDDGLAKRMSASNGNHESFRQDILYQPAIPKLINANCRPVATTNGFMQKFTIEDDLLLKKATLIETICVVLGINHNHLLDNALKSASQVFRAPGAKPTNLDKLSSLYEITKSEIDKINPETFATKLASAYLQSLKTYLTSLPDTSLTLEEKMNQDNAAFNDGMKAFTEKCDKMQQAMPVITPTQTEDADPSVEGQEAETEETDNYLQEGSDDESKSEDNYLPEGTDEEPKAEDNYLQEGTDEEPKAEDNYLSEGTDDESKNEDNYLPEGTDDESKAEDNYLQGSTNDEYPDASPTTPYVEKPAEPTQAAIDVPDKVKTDLDIIGDDIQSAIDILTLIKAKSDAEHALTASRNDLLKEREKYAEACRKLVIAEMKLSNIENRSNPNGHDKYLATLKLKDAKSFCENSKSNIIRLKEKSSELINTINAHTQSLEQHASTHKDRHPTVTVPENVHSSYLKH